MGDIWDPDHEKLMVKTADEIPLPPRRKKKDEENKKGDEAEGEGGQSLELVKSGNNGQIIPPGFQ